MPIERDQPTHATLPIRPPLCFPVAALVVLIVSLALWTLNIPLMFLPLAGRPILTFGDLLTFLVDYLSALGTKSVPVAILLLAIASSAWQDRRRARHQIVRALDQGRAHAVERSPWFLAHPFPGEQIDVLRQFAWHTVNTPAPIEPSHEQIAVRGLFDTTPSRLLWIPLGAAIWIIAIVGTGLFARHSIAPLVTVLTLLPVALVPLVRPTALTLATFGYTPLADPEALVIPRPLMRTRRYLWSRCALVIAGTANGAARCFVYDTTTRRSDWITIPNARLSEFLSVHAASRPRADELEPTDT